MSRHLHTFRTPLGRVTYTHHDLETLSDGTDRFLSDGYLVPVDGSVAIQLPLDELLRIIASYGTGEMVRLSGLPTASSEFTFGPSARVAANRRAPDHLTRVAR